MPQNALSLMISHLHTWRTGPVQPLTQQDSAKSHSPGRDPYTLPRDTLSLTPRHTFTPCRNGSVFDDFILTSTKLGFTWLSMQTSSSVRLTCGSKLELDVNTTSPQRRSQKMHIQAAAHNIAPFLSVQGDHDFLSTLNKSGVMGSLVLGGLPVTFLIPLIIYPSWGMSLMRGSSSPKLIWACLTAAI